ncbi:hypothetical protein NDU88_003916 [Pleurodeles waltl]|uniref:Uncharacterized protein n=1 Tax=Pleurodeles waltl TaxID=8319 RepID=A0AAV7UE64_PLEWA|nr:hypothetical protein NDU88_003916 [Pleurodeles waltl]
MPARTIHLHVLSLSAVTRNPKRAPPIREEPPGHGRKAEEQKGWRRAFEVEKCRKERQVRNEDEERTRTTGPEDQRDEGAVCPNQGREYRRDEGAVRPNRGREDRRDQGAVRPNQGREDVNPGSGMH